MFINIYTLVKRYIASKLKGKKIVISKHGRSKVVSRSSSSKSSSKKKSRSKRKTYTAKELEGKKIVIDDKGVSTVVEKTPEVQTSTVITPVPRMKNVPTTPAENVPPQQVKVTPVSSAVGHTAGGQVTINSPQTQAFGRAAEIAKDKPMVLGGRIDAAPKKNLGEKIVDKTVGAAKDFYTGFKGGFFQSSDTGSKLRGEGINPPTERAGALVGIVTSVASPGKVLKPAGKVVSFLRGTTETVKASKYVKPVVNVASKVYESTRLVKYLVQAGRTVLIGEGTRRTVEGIGVERVGVTDAYIDNKGVDRALGAGYRAEQKAISSDTSVKGYIKRLAYDVSSGFTSDKNAFLSGARTSLESQGYSGERLSSALSSAEKKRNIAGISETAGFIGASASVEQIGRKEVGRVLAKTGYKIPEGTAKQTMVRLAPSVGIAGTIEGGAVTYSFQKARREPTDIKEIMGMAAMGGVSATLIGAPIVGFSSVSPFKSRFVEGIANVIDPLEKPGDIVADIAEAGFRSTVPTVSVPTTFPASTTASTNVNVISSPSFSSVPSVAPPSYPTLNPAPQSFTMTPISETAPMPSSVPPASITPSSTSSSTSTIVPSDTITNIFVSQPSQTPTSVPVATSVPITPTTSTFNSYGKGVFFPTVMPGGGGGGFKPFKNSFLSQAKGYTPSFSAIALGITSTEKDPLAVKTGMGLRPIIVSKGSKAKWGF